MLQHMALVRTDFSEEHTASIIRVTRIVTVQRASVADYCYAVPTSPIIVTLMMETVRLSETSVLTRATRRNILEDGILHRHRRQNLKSYIALTGWDL
jgi:hypothetical protein